MKLLLALINILIFFSCENLGNFPFREGCYKNIKIKSYYPKVVWEVGDFLGEKNCKQANFIIVRKNQANRLSRVDFYKYNKIIQTIKYRYEPYTCGATLLAFKYINGFLDSILIREESGTKTAYDTYDKKKYGFRLDAYDDPAEKRNMVGGKILGFFSPKEEYCPKYWGNG